MMMMERLLQQDVSTSRPASRSSDSRSPRSFMFTGSSRLLHHPSSAFLRPDDKDEKDEESPGESPKTKEENKAEDPMDLENRLSSDDDFLTVDDDVGSPVDLTSRHRLLTRLTDRMVSSPSSGSTGEERDTEASPHRRLAFSVENILDPNKFTGREKELIPRFGAPQWRPHADAVNSSDIINQSGEYVCIL